MFAVHNYQQGVQRLLAACDEGLLDKTFSEGRFRLEVKASFYDGMRVDADDFVAMLRACTMANLVGDETVAAAVDAGVIDPANVRRIEGVPHAQFLVIQP